jgi:DNA-binding NtrC family response regulator
MGATMALARRYASLPRDLLLVGPTGSGKNYLAALIHRASGRLGALVTITGGQLTDSLWSSQLFGHFAGAFTDAKHRVRGAFEQAADGTLFLDELHHWSPAVQSGLLQPLGERRFRPLGTDRDVDVTSRLLFATTMSPDTLVESGRLLPDLRYRLPALLLTLPSLASRREDILPLVAQFTTATLRSFGWNPEEYRWSAAAVRGMLLYHWPGNIRELHQVVERALAQVGPTPPGEIGLEQLDLPPGPQADLAELLAPEALRRVVLWALECTHGSRKQAGELLGVHRNTITRYIARWGLSAGEASTAAPPMVHSRPAVTELALPASA